MVDVNKTERLLFKYFDVTGSHTIDEKTGQVHVHGSVRCIRKLPKGLFPITFGIVDGTFTCEGSGCKSLVGAPDHVGEYFDCRKNKLINLQGAPSHVGKGFHCGENQITTLAHMPTHTGGFFWCYENPLESLVGWDAPVHVGGEFWCTYTSELPLLRCLQASKVDVVTGSTNKTGPQANAVQKILDKYVGKGKAAMLNCALELKQADLRGNAAW